MKLFQNKKQKRRENLNIIIMSVLIFITLILLIIKNNIDYSELKKQIAVSNPEEFVLAISDNKNLLLNSDIKVELSEYVLDHDINIDLNGYNLTINGELIVNEKTINVTDDSDSKSGTLNLTNLSYNTDYTNIDEPENRNIKVITSDINTENILISDTVEVEATTSNENNEFEVYYPYINYVYQSQKEAIELDDYLYNNSNYENMIITKPVAPYLKDAVITKDIYIDIEDGGKVVLAGTLSFKSGRITINTSDINQIDISRLRVSLDNTEHDGILIQINGTDIVGLEAPKNTFISDNKIIINK